MAAQPTDAAGGGRFAGAPPPGKLYHGVYPGGVSGEEDDIRPENLTSYEQLAGKSAAWVYFSDNWYKGRSFPLETATWIRSAGSVPFIRLMLRSSPQQNISEPTFTLARVVNGTFDADLRAWAQAAKSFGSPLLAEYGTEVNGRWFSWNGVWNGGADLGPARFREAYCHIVQVMKGEGASNIVWVFHVNHNDVPADPWNRFENYYPGDKCVDWVGVSVYGPQSPLDDETRSFRDIMDEVYPRLITLNSTKPIVLLEFGASAGNPRVDQAAWAGNALGNLTSFRWPRMIGFAWWNERWPNDSNPAHDTDMRLQGNPALASVFKTYVGVNDNVLASALIASPAASTSTSTSTSSAGSQVSLSTTPSGSTLSTTVASRQGTTSVSSGPTASTVRGNGIPESPPLPVVTSIFTALILASYLFLGRHRSARQQ
jgi:hypothetical protein